MRFLSLSFCLIAAVSRPTGGLTTISCYKVTSNLLSCAGASVDVARDSLKWLIPVITLAVPSGQDSLAQESKVAKTHMNQTGTYAAWRGQPRYV